MSIKVDISKMTPAERLALLEDIWNSLSPSDIPLTAEQRVELDSRLDELEQDSGAGIPWDDVLQKIRNRSA